MSVTTGVGSLPTASPDTVPTELVELLARAGIVVLPGWLDGAGVRAAAQEATRLLAAELPGAERLGYSAGAGVRIDRADLPAEYPVLREVFGAGWMAEVAALFFGDRPHVANHDVIAVRDVVGTDHAARQPHYDRTPNLKFFAYLTDTTAATGAFCCLPGSHGFARRAQAANRAARRLPAQADTRVLPEHLTRGLVPVEAPAGTLLLIDSDIVHRGAPVRTGHRLAVRSRSYDPTLT